MGQMKAKGRERSRPLPFPIWKNETEAGYYETVRNFL